MVGPMESDETGEGVCSIRAAAVAGFGCVPHLGARSGGAHRQEAGVAADRDEGEAHRDGTDTLTTPLYSLSPPWHTQAYSHSPSSSSTEECAFSHNCAGTVQ